MILTIVVLWLWCSCGVMWLRLDVFVTMTSSQHRMFIIIYSFHVIGVFIFWYFVSGRHLQFKNICKYFIFIFYICIVHINFKVGFICTIRHSAWSESRAGLSEWPSITRYRSVVVVVKPSIDANATLSNFDRRKLKKLKKSCGKMGFPHLPRPPAPSLELWVQTFSCQKRPCGLGRFFFICQASTWSPFSENSHKSGVEPETSHLTEFDRR